MKKTILITSILLATSLPAVAENSTIITAETDIQELSVTTNNAMYLQLQNLDRAGWLNLPPKKPKRGVFVPTLPPAKPK